MADLEEALGNILADPQAMEQILSLASKLGLEDQGQDQEAGQEDGRLEQAGPAVPPPLLGPDQLGQLGQFVSLLREGTDPQVDALLSALRPYLNPARQEKLDRARRLAGLSRAARQAYRLWKEGELHL